jgi:hypothetical protein
MSHLKKSLCGGQNEGCVGTLEMGPLSGKGRSGPHHGKPYREGGLERW